MTNHQDRIDQLNQKLETLLNKQEGFAKELMLLYKEIEEVKKLKPEQLAQLEKIEAPVEENIQQIESITQPETIIEEIKKEVMQEAITAPKQSEKFDLTKIQKPNSKSNLEKFIGENIINKIGIIILIIGVAIGAKYSIENDLINPLTRIILGYIAGIGLIGFGSKLKAKYENYSSVLVSGALAILYFITFAAYDFYGLFPQIIAFGLMLLLTIFGVVAALSYNKQIIAHIGLVGAYAIPFLLSNDSGNVTVLFSYITIINIGVLAISFKKYWKPLYYSAFIFTWLIYGVFIASSYKAEEHFPIALLFNAIFFALFYTNFLAYKLKANEKFRKSDIILLLINSFIFYGFGYFLLENHEIGSNLLGVFTLVNAIIHFAVSSIIFKKKLADRNLFYLVSGLVLIFITIAIPVQLDGNWVTLLWALEAALLFWIGRTKKATIYENLSYPLMVLAFFSLTHDWSVSYDAYDKENHFIAILNSSFLSSMLFVAAFGFINYVNHKTSTAIIETNRNWIAQIMTYGMPILILLAIYGSFFTEIEYYWDKQFQNSKIAIEQVTGSYSSEYNYDLKKISNIWLINYTLLFMSVLAFVNIKKIKNKVLGIATLIMSLMVCLIFLSNSLYMLSELRESFITKDLSPYHEVTPFSIGIRYVAFGFFALFLVVLYKLTRCSFIRNNLKKPFEIVMHISILWVISSELLNWMDLAGSKQTYKLGLSILWGVYSLTLIGIGIWKEKKYLRVGAIALFAITLLKLFFYDIASMNTITKTIVFVSLGILLLIISFLYNKYKHIITDEK